MRTLGFYGKTTQSLLVSALLMSAMAPADATQLNPANAPLILTPSVAPNLILTLDNSGSMRLAYAPDTIGNTFASRRAKSNTFNPMYYDPAVTYKLPLKIAANGSEAATPYSTSFTAAQNNGFLANTTTGTLNLETSYKVSWDSAWETALPSTYVNTTDYGPSLSNTRLAANPEPDFYFTTTVTNTQSNGSTSTPYTVNNVVFTVRRDSSTGTACTAVITTPLNNQTVTCSRNTNNNVYTITTNDRRKPAAGVPAYYYVYDTSQTNCTSVISNRINDDNCYKLVNVSATSGQVRADDLLAGTDERLNFSRWYSFYRTRALATLSAANLAFDTLDPNVRLTWQNLGGTSGSSSCIILDSSGSSSSCSNIANYLRKFTAQHRGNFFSWLTSFKFDQYTPLRAAVQRAGEFTRTDNAWAENPHPLNTTTGATGATVTGTQYACRANYHILMTDGRWNENPVSFPSPSGTFMHDGANADLPGSIDYGQQRPFADATTQTLADLAFHYWASDARALANTVKAYIPVTDTNATTQFWNPKNDPATWQHLSTFTIGLGLTESLQQPGLAWSGDTFGGAGYNALVNGTAWPPASDDSANNVYDLWHAAINSRGKFFSADNPSSIITAFAEILARINGGVASAGAPGVTASVVNDVLTRDVYETQLDSDDWSGNLSKYTISASGTRTAAWNVRARIANQTASNRTIKMFSSTASSKLTNFTWDNLSPTQQALLNINNDSTATPNTDSNGAARLLYIRGDQSNEGTAAGQFRERSSVLGDIINSAPVIVATPKYVSYLADSIEGLSATDANNYSAFKTAQRADGANPPRTPMVYVGANDGMLHGFNANTGDEVFAFVPTAVLKNLYRLPAQNYAANHRFFVDGTPVVNDVFFGGAWHTVLIGTLRAGGRSLFALDITNPTAITLLWERSFDDTTPAADLTNLGYTFPQPVIARLHTGKWAVVTGNGYGNQAGSTVDKASLMIFDIQTGALQRELVVPGNTALPNGLSSVKLADNNSDGIADYAYAGDLQGNMWRFDLVTTSATPAAPDPFLKSAIGTINANTFAISYGGSPLYTAYDGRASGTATTQAISAPPSLVRHPSGIGYLVIFGTGKYFETADGTADTARAFTLYGIWDRQTKGQITAARSTPLNRSNLQAQRITEQPANAFASNNAVDGIRLISQDPFEWYTAGRTTTTDNDVNKWGWLLDFKVTTGSNAGEMLINPMATRGQTLLLNTITPNPDPCSEGVGSWQYGIDPYTGGRTKFNVFDLDNSKTIGSGDSVLSSGVDTVVSSYKKKGSGGFTTNNGEIFTSPDGVGMKYSGGPNSSGRQSWRVIE
ncbi:PilC/PilY family type IV pilus protein [Pseudomonas sp. LS44]|uniref:pilus assembly protein n=1 Tax=Pseudomonas sp. LS44 TaxID=1357074 RepID=UPI00215A1953|nr:PilC/PilY family type IV pilus protein [Pseudomonas sp. LS44]UVE18494.1 PilC/PilY family type IV pilus protein [Pseudomonas sp. LS44]